MSGAVVTPASLDRPEGRRHYLLARPSDPAPGKRPLVILLHGHGSSAALTFGRGDFGDPSAVWLEIAQREGLLVIAPDGWKGSSGKQGWNDCRADAPTNPVSDDVGFLSAVIDLAIAEHDADPRRVHVVGMSNGGGMTYRLAIELGPRLAAVAVLSGLMPARSLCAPPRHALPILITHGSADRIAPYDGGEVGHALTGARGSGIAVEQALALWRALAGLPDSPCVTPVAHRDPADPTTATRYVWGADPCQIQVGLLKIDLGGHVSPSIAKRASPAMTTMLGRQNGDLEFAEEAWAFFADKRARATL